MTDVIKIIGLSILAFIAIALVELIVVGFIGYCRVKLREWRDRHGW